MTSRGLKIAQFFRDRKGTKSNLAQIITPEMAKLGPDNNFKAYIYIYIFHIYML